MLLSLIACVGNMVASNGDTLASPTSNPGAQADTSSNPGTAVRKPRLAVSVKENKLSGSGVGGGVSTPTEGMIDMGFDILMDGGALFDVGVTLIKPKTGLAWGLGVYLGRLDSDGDSAEVCDAGGFGSECEYRDYVMSTYGLDILLGYHKSFASAPWIELQCMAGPSIGAVDKDIVDCSNCSKDSNSGIGLTLQPEIQLYFGGAYYAAATSRFTAGGPNPGASVGAHAGIHLK